MKDKRYQDSVVKRILSGSGTIEAVSGELGISPWELDSWVQRWMKDHSILLGEGFGKVRLGMTRTEVTEVMKEPQVYQEWMGGNLNSALLFNGLCLHFDACDQRQPLPNSRLNWIVIYVGDYQYQRDDVFLFGKALLEWNQDTVTEELKRRAITIQESKRAIDASPGMRIIFNDQGRILQVELAAC